MRTSGITPDPSRHPTHCTAQTQVGTLAWAFWLASESMAEPLRLRRSVTFGEVVGAAGDAGDTRVGRLAAVPSQLVIQQWAAP